MQALKENKTQEYLSTARKRVEFGDDWREMEYRDESDLLLIRFSSNKVVRSRGDVKNGLIRNYDRNDELVNIEVTDFYGVYV